MASKSSSRSRSATSNGLHDRLEFRQSIALNRAKAVLAESLKDVVYSKPSVVARRNSPSPVLKQSPQLSMAKPGVLSSSTKNQAGVVSSSSAYSDKKSTVGRKTGTLSVDRSLRTQKPITPCQRPDGSKSGSGSSRSFIPWKAKKC